MSKSALRVLEIMEFIAQQRDGCSHTYIAQELNIPKSSLTALLQDLLSKGYLTRRADNGAFTIGVQVLSLANSYLRNLNLVRIGQPAVAQLFAQSKEFSVMAIPMGWEYVVICIESVPSVIGHSMQLGQRGALVGSALGKAMLAFMPPAQIDQIIADTPTAQLPGGKRNGFVAAFKTELDKIRRTGLAYSRGEAVQGVYGYAAPVLGNTGTPIAAIGVGALSTTLQPKSVPLIERAVKETAAALSAQMGWRLDATFA